MVKGKRPVMSMKDQFIYINLRSVDKVTEKMRKKETGKRMQQDVECCYICDRLEDNLGRYYHTFFALLKEEEFRIRVENSKGFCMHHFSQLLHVAEEKLPNAQRQWFYDTVFSLMEENLNRVKDDLDWLITMHDYRNASADWKNSRDALQRTIQKLGGGYVADKPYREE